MDLTKIPINDRQDKTMHISRALFHVRCPLFSPKSVELSATGSSKLVWCQSHASVMPDLVVYSLFLRLIVTHFQTFQSFLPTRSDSELFHCLVHRKNLLLGSRIGWWTVVLCFQLSPWYCWQSDSLFVVWNLHRLPSSNDQFRIQFGIFLSNRHIFLLLFHPPLTFKVDCRVQAIDCLICSMTKETCSREKLALIQNIVKFQKKVHLNVSLISI